MQEVRSRVGGPDDGCSSGEPGGRGDGHAVAVHDPGGDGKVNSNLFKFEK